MSIRNAYKTVDVWLPDSHKDRTHFHYNENGCANYILAIRDREKLPRESYLYGGVKLNRKNIKKAVKDLPEGLNSYVAGVLVTRFEID